MNKNERSKKVSPVIPELLAPAGNFEKMRTAIHYGADAVYMGGKQFSLRARAGNFDDETMAEAVRYAHTHNVKVYITINIFAHNRDFAGLDDYLFQLQKADVDGLIISDPGILGCAVHCVPEIPIHLSTQANVSNAQAAAFWFEQGVSRLNLARELSLEEIQEVRRQNSKELEIFVHGALCISYSGRCMLSNYMTGRDANQGACAHPCRYSYKLVEEKRPDEYFPVEEDERGTYIFNSKDLCLLEGLPELVASGVNSLKIEGRMKSIFYVGGVTRIYRAALDYLKSLPVEAWQSPEDIVLPAEFGREIVKTGTRGVSENFFKQAPGSSEMLYNTSRVPMEVEPVAVIRKEGSVPLVEARNVLETGDQIEYMLPGIEYEACTVTAMKTEKGEEIQRANPGNIVLLCTEPALKHTQLNGILRRNIK